MALRHREALSAVAISETAAACYSPPRSDEEQEGILEKVEGIGKS
jgi:hypothetical protein